MRAKAKSISTQHLDTARSSTSKQEIAMSDTINDRTSPTLSNSWAVLTDQVATEEAEGNKPVTDLHRGSTENVVALGDDVPPTASALGHDPAFSDHQRCNNPECIEWAIIQKRRLNGMYHYS